MREELLSPEHSIEDEEIDIELEALGLRPTTLEDFIGQPELKEHLAIILGAAKNRNQPSDHLLFAGPPGLGKTTLANIVAREMEVGLHTTSGPALERPGDLAAILTKLEPGDVLFIDEIHRLSRAVEEVLYPAMEDFPWEGSGSTFGSANDCTIYPSGSNYSNRFDYRSFARPIWIGGTNGLLRI